GRRDGALHRHSRRASGRARPLGDGCAPSRAPEARGRRGPRLSEERLRLFVALDLPPDILEPLVAWREAAYRARDDARLPRPETLHATLAFLGQADERDAGRVE